MATELSAQHLVSLQDASAADTIGRAWAMNHANKTQYIVEWSEGCTAGTVVFESAPFGYTGDVWQNVLTVPFVAENRVDVIMIEEQHEQVRARILEEITGGTINALMKGYA